MSDMLDAFMSQLLGTGLTVAEQLSLEPRPERKDHAPPPYLRGNVGQWLTGPALQGQLWTYQAEALRRFDSGANVVVSTAPASGKSLIFQAATLRLLDQYPDGAVLVFYPLKALVADQLVSWRRILIEAGYSPDMVGRIDGDVLPDERDGIIRKARVLVATPDVTHAWLMSNLAKPNHQHFLARLKLIIIDEAHVLEAYLVAISHISLDEYWLHHAWPTGAKILYHSGSLPRVPPFPIPPNI